MTDAPDTFIRVDGIDYPASAQPPQSDLQGAFVADGPAIVVDMDLARPIAREMIRRARTQHWPAVDAARNKAVERGDGMDAVKARAEALRAATKDTRIEAAQTPDDLLAVVEAIIAEMGSAP